MHREARPDMKEVDGEIYSMQREGGADMKERKKDIY